MRFALIGPSAPFRGGIAQHTDRVAEALRVEHEVDLYPFARQYPNWLFPGRDQRDPAAAPQPGARVALDPYRPRSLTAVASDIAERQPDLVLLQWWHPWFAWSTRGLLRRLRSSSPGRRAVLCHNALPHQPVPLQRTLTRLALREADRFVVHAESERNLLHTLIRTGAPITRAFLPCLAPPSEAPPQAEARRRLVDRGLIPPVDQLVLFFGLVRDYKGLDDLLAALPHMERRAHLLVAGEFYTPRERFERAIATLGLGDRVTLLDRYVPTDEIPTLFAAADAVGLPYRSATQSSVLPLAVHYRRPFVVTTVGGLADAAQGLGQLVPPREPIALAKGLDAALATESLDQSRWCDAAERFTPAGIRRVIEELVRSAGPRDADRSRTADPASVGQPIASVIVAAHDACPDLEATLAALERQQPPGLAEVVVAYDGSADSLRRRLGPKGESIRIVDRCAASLNAKRNRGVAEATTDRVLFTDDDCVPDPHWVANMVDALDRHEIVSGRALPLGDGVRASIRDRGHARRFTGFLDRITAWRAGCGNNLGARRETLARLGGFDPRIGVGTPSGAGCDTELLFRALSERGGSVHYEPSAIVRHRQQPFGPEAVDKRRRYYRGLSFMARRIHPRSPSAWIMAGLRLGYTACATLWATVRFARTRRTLHWAELCGSVQGLFQRAADGVTR